MFNRVLCPRRACARPRRAHGSAGGQPVFDPDRVLAHGLDDQGRAGYAVTPYHVDVPTFGDWGFALARRGDTSPTPTMPPDTSPLRFLNQSVLDAATVFAGDVRPQTLEASTLENPRIVEDMRRGYR